MVVNSRDLHPALRVLRIGLDLMVAALLALAAVRAPTAHRDAAVTVVAVAVLLAALYTVGASRHVRGSTTRATVWLAAVMAVWVVLLVLTPDGVWLAFPLFFCQLHILPPRRALVAVALTTASAIIGFGWHTHSLTIGTAVGPILGAAVATGTVFGFQALYRESEHRRRLIEQLTATRDELAAAERTAGALAERERLAREIHDTLTQGLSSIQLLLRAAERALPGRSEAALEHVRHARGTAVDNLAEARRFVRALSPPDLEAGSLPAALERLCATTADTSGLAVQFHLSGEPADLPTPLEVALLRIAQSALANTVQHAHATRAELTLSYMDSEVALDIVDDGCGFNADALPDPGGSGGFGLPAMRARAHALGGGFVIESAPGDGTAVAVTVPVVAPEQATA